jgi:hypothetical protein
MQIANKQIPLIALMLFIIGGTVVSYAIYSVVFRTHGTFEVVNDEAIVAPTDVDFGEFNGLGGAHAVEAIVRTASGTVGSYRVHLNCANLPPTATLELLVGGIVVQHVDVEPHAQNPRAVVVRLTIPADYPTTEGYTLNIDWVGELLT